MWASLGICEKRSCLARACKGLYLDELARTHVSADESMLLVGELEGEVGAWGRQSSIGLVKGGHGNEAIVVQDADGLEGWQIL